MTGFGTPRNTMTRMGWKKEWFVLFRIGRLKIRDVRQNFRVARKTPIFQILKTRQKQNAKNRPKWTPKRKTL